MHRFRGRRRNRNPFNTFDRYALRPHDAFHRGRPRWVLNRPLGRTMLANDVPVIEDPDVLLAAIERTREALVIVERDGHVSHFNAAAERIWGLTRADVLGCDVSRLGLGDLLGNLQADHVAAPAGASINGEDAIAGSGAEITIQRHDGSRIRAALSLSRLDAGDQSRILAFARDIT